MPGSIGATDPAHVFKGKRMPGRMGGGQATVTNLEIVQIDSEEDLLYIKGAVPGARNGLLLIQAPGELKTEDQRPKTEDRRSKTEDHGSKTEDRLVLRSPKDEGGRSKIKDEESKIEEPEVEKSEEKDNQ